MITTTGAPIVVGVDGTASALSAVRLAAWEADTRRRPLRVVHAFIWSQMRVPLGPSPLGPPEGGLRNQADRIVAEAIAEAKRVAPQVAVTGDIVDGAAATVLLHEAHRAGLLVLGNRGLGGFAGLLIGSVAVQVATHISCPLLVARGNEPEDNRGNDRPVVVGVDGSPLSDLAIGFAMEEAALRNAGLVALHAWTRPVSSGPGDMLPLVYDADVVRDEEQTLLAEALAGWSERYPDVPVTRRLVRESAAKALVAESTTAQLVVVGARGRGGFTGLLLGSVSQTVLHHVQCPLMIVRRSRHPT